MYKVQVESTPMCKNKNGEQFLIVYTMAKLEMMIQVRDDIGLYGVWFKGSNVDKKKLIKLFRILIILEIDLLFDN